MILSAVFGLMPWYSWASAIAVLVAVSMLGLWPVLIALLRMIPKPVWIAIGATVAIALAARGIELAIKAHDDNVRKAAVLERDAYWGGREKVANERYDAAMKHMGQLLDASDARLQLANDEHKKELARRQRASDERFRALDAQRSTNVTPTANARCDLTRGVIVQFNAGAAGANAGPDDPPAEAAAASGSVSPDDRSDVPLDRYARAVEDTQRALGTCRNQVTGWQRYHDNVILPWIASTTEAFASCIPKGTP